jgi:3'(2'), 5'-bisphosphate nucleotidase
VNRSRLLPLVADIAQQAGQAILEVYAENFEVDYKEDESPLTRADLASHCIIQDALAALTPDIPLLSEESAEIDFDTRSAWSTYWLVDPLDGTKEFVKRNGEFTVNIALIENHEPVLGVVHVPVSRTTYTGLPGKDGGPGRAMRSRADEDPERIGVRACREPMVVVGSRSHANPRLEEHLARLGEYELVSMGSSLKFCLVAEGRADFYPRLGPTSEWDTAAAHAVVLAAGGRIVQLDGTPLEYNRKASLLNPEFLVIANDSRDWLSAFESGADENAA